MVERQPSADATTSQQQQQPQPQPPTQQQQFNILSQLNLPLSIPPPPAAFQIHPNGDKLNAAAPTFTPQQAQGLGTGYDAVSAQIAALQQAQTESMAKLQLLSYQLNSLNLVNQQSQTMQSLNQYQSIYQQYQLEFTHQMILNQYLANIKPLNIPQILFQNDNKSDIKSPKSSQLETIEEGENEEEQMEESRSSSLFGCSHGIPCSGSS